MKRVLSVLLCIVFSISLVACASNSESNQNSGVPSSSVGSGSAEDTAVKSEDKALVVYFSATGSTKAVAETISETLGADIFEIEPTKPYTSDDLDWSDDNSRVSVEHSDESKRNVSLKKSTPDNWEQYKVVYIGYPIWWGIAAWPVNGFVKGNDFTNKTVIPFCTSASSGVGDSAELLKDLAGTGNWLDGERFSSGASKEDVDEWLNELFAN